MCIYVYIIYIHIYELNYRFGMNCITDLRIGFTGGKGTLTKTRSLKEEEMKHSSLNPPITPET